MDLAERPQIYGRMLLAKSVFQDVEPNLETNGGSEMSDSTCDSPEPNADLYDMDEGDLRDMVITMRESWDSLILRVDGMEREVASLRGKLVRRDKKIESLKSGESVAILKQEFGINPARNQHG
jgi:hypothetical protein